MALQYEEGRPEIEQPSHATCRRIGKAFRSFERLRHSKLQAVNGYNKNCDLMKETCENKSAPFVSRLQSLVPNHVL
jgi:hypothetical protein